MQVQFWFEKPPLADSRPLFIWDMRLWSKTAETCNHWPFLVQSTNIRVVRNAWMSFCLSKIYCGTDALNLLYWNWNGDDCGNWPATEQHESRRLEQWKPFLVVHILFPEGIVVRTSNNSCMMSETDESPWQKAISNKLKIECIFIMNCPYVRAIELHQFA